MIAAVKAKEDWIVPVEICVGLSAMSFWEKFFKDEAELGFDKFMESRGEQNVNMGLWEEAKPGDDGVIFGHRATQMRQMTMVVQVKGNPMVKECPTTKTYYLIENSATKLHVFCRNNTREVPYCDSFQVIEEFLLLSPDPSTQPEIKSGALRMSFHLQWLKSTLMKSLIRGNVETETKAVFNGFVENLIKAKKLAFVEKKAPVSSKKGRSMMVESSLHL